MNCFDPETGELTDEAAFEQLQMARDEKIESVALWVKDLASEAEALKAEKQAFADRQKAAENKAESLKNWLKYALNGTSFKTTRAAVNFRRTKSVKVDNVLDLPAEYIRYGEPSADKKAIKQAIEAGQTVSGAELVESTSISIK
jgi:hypothetical protein